MHVDKNNQGPSYIIGLGEYEGGGLWIYDQETGTHELKVQEKLGGSFKHLTPGTIVKRQSGSSGSANILEEASLLSLVDRLRFRVG
jgi:hypothetical protein